MFAPRYFPNRMFAPRYWPDGGATPTVQTPIVFDKRLRLRTQSLSNLLERISVAVALNQRIASVSGLEQRIQPIYRTGQRVSFTAKLRKGGG